MPVLSRRSMLRGLGAGSVLLGGIGRNLRAETEGRPRPPRALFLFYANGSHHGWTPSGDGDAFTLTRHLAPLERIRNEVIILRGLSLQRGKGNPHKAATLSVLGAGAPTSFDQLLVESTRRTTPLPSLELAIGFTSGAGGEAPSLSQINGAFLPGERNPVAAYQRVVSRISPGPSGRSTVSAATALAAERSLLDSLREDVRAFRPRLGSAERPKLDLYLESVRDLEKRLGSFGADLAAAPACGKILPPTGAANFVARVSDMPKVSRLFCDVMALALACGVTRIASIMWGGGESGEPVDFIGMRDWHGTSHRDPSGPGGEMIIKMQAYLAGEFTYLVEKLRSFGQGPGSLLDGTVVVFGTQNGNSNQTNFANEDHDRRNAPIILAGRCAGAFHTGRVLDCEGANHNDVYLSIARAFGLAVKTVGEPSWCRGPLPGLTQA
jgi:hypothetical protein